MWPQQKAEAAEPHGAARGLLHLALDAEGEAAVLAVAVDSDILVEGTGAACGVVGHDDLALLAWGDGLAGMLGRGAGAGRGDARDDQRSIASILDDKGMRDLTISLQDRAEVELRHGRRDDCPLGSLS